MIKSALLIPIALILSLCDLQAQQTTVSAEGDATGSNNNIRYFIGQALYHDGSSDDTSVTEGVLKSFLVYTLAMSDPFEMSVSIYPNPTILSQQIDQINELSCQLHDQHGSLSDASSITATVLTGYQLITKS